VADFEEFWQAAVAGWWIDYFRGSQTPETDQLVGADIAIQAVRNFRTPTIDTLIATHCIMNGLTLLYSDRDFDPFVEHLGLRTAS
jgi:predicted nucleic acid-binding protein